MVVGDSGFLNQALLQEAAEACRMRSRNTDVLVEMEHLHFFPVNAGKLGECFEKLKLSSPGRGDDARLPVLLDSFAQCLGSFVRRNLCHFVFVVKSFDDHSKRPFLIGYLFVDFCVVASSRQSFTDGNTSWMEGCGAPLASSE